MTSLRLWDRPDHTVARWPDVTMLAIHALMPNFYEDTWGDLIYDAQRIAECRFSPLLGALCALAHPQQGCNALLLVMGFDPIKAHSTQEG